MNDVSKSILEAEHIKKTLGIDDYEQFLEYKNNAVVGMMQFGDNFIKSLGVTLSHADVYQTVKIMRSFYFEVDENAMLYKILKAKQEGNENK